MNYDVVIIGTGPAGQRAAQTAAKYRPRVAVVERNRLIGGVSLNTGTIPSKTLREAAMYLSGRRLRDVYGEGYSVKRDVTMEDLLVRCRYVMQQEREMVKKRMSMRNIDMIEGLASFLDPHTLKIQNGDSSTTIKAEKVILATGSVARRPPGIQFRAGSVFDSDEVPLMPALPGSLLVVGAGVIGAEYATIFASLNIEVTLVDGRTTILDFVDREIVDSLMYHMRDLGITLRLGECVQSVEWIRDDRVVAHLESGKRIIAQNILVAAGRRAATADLNLDAAGLKVDENGRLKANEFFQTEVPHIYAAGDVIGFPALASTSMEQGRIAARHACEREIFNLNNVYPYGIYTIPEISTIGRTEAELTAAKVPYETAVAQYKDVVRGRIVGDKSGMLKILFHLHTHEILGVHAIGEGSTELIHIGQAVMAHGGKLDYFVDTVFNYPTLAEAYKIAALDGISKLSFA
ncbi:MAG: Si-specific NAD(P)(+) transhydrogenase [Blastocatellia bacterium]|nr:Si-specific NAD(P)(+) transhydrogenase [Blastocatellia bacterium]